MRTGVCARDRWRVSHISSSRSRRFAGLCCTCRQSSPRPSGGGWKVVSSRGYESTGVSVEVRGHAYAIGFQELHDRVPLTTNELERWRKKKEWQLRWNPGLKEPTHKSVPNGYLKLVSPSWHGGRSTWSEGPRGPLDRKLPSFFDELERRADQDDVRAEQLRREAELQRQRELELIEQRRLAQIEESRASVR